MYKPRLDLWPGRSRPHPPSLMRLNLGKNRTDLRGSGHFLERALMSPITSQSRSLEEVEQTIAQCWSGTFTFVDYIVTKPHNLMSDVVGLLTVAMQYYLDLAADCAPINRGDSKF